MTFLIIHLYKFLIRVWCSYRKMIGTSVLHIENAECTTSVFDISASENGMVQAGDRISIQCNLKIKF